MRTSLLLICLYTVNSFIARPYLYKNNYITLSRRADDYLEDENINDNVNKDKPKPIVYRYRGIPPKLCASEEEEKMLEKIEETAKKKWKLLGTCIIHRYGELFPGEQIVLVITTSKHRKEAVESCHFIIDWLKTKGPFWKYEKTNDSGFWVEAKQSDIDEELKWKI